jgi:NAD-dependent SIR2 family protein deacetylase
LAALRFDTQTIVEVRQSARKKKKTERTGDFQTQSEPFSGSREPHIPLNYEQIVWRIRTRQYTKIVFVVGAGASVAAGIPDFRSLISGLYAQVADAELKVQKPDDVFKLSHFKVCPSDFYIVARKFFLGSSAVPSQAQHFMKHCADFGLLLDVFTQNIDGLELDAGLSLEQVTQVHGHMRTASCVDCKSPHDASSFFKNLATDTLMYCDEQSCGGLVKPDIIFFDEGILSDTIQRLSAISASDLVIVMGTSLKVNPMSYTMEHLPKTIPVLVMDIKLPEVLNRRKTNNLVFVEGQIERSVQCISEDFRWSQSALKNRIDSNTFTTVFTQTNNNTTSVATSSGSCIEDVVGDKTVSFYNFRNIIDESNLVNMTLDWPSVRSLFCLQVRNMAPFPVALYFVDISCFFLKCSIILRWCSTTQVRSTMRCLSTERTSKAAMTACGMICCFSMGFFPL